MSPFFRYLLLIITLATVSSSAQTLQWGKSIGSTNDDAARSISIDGAGNVITAGSFRAQIDLDPGANTVNVNVSGNQDIFITKSDSLGNYIWGRKIGGPSIDSVTAIYLYNNFIYVTGFFQGTTDFNPGPSTNFLTSTANANNTDAFLLKLDASGIYQWAVSFGGADNDQALDISVLNGEIAVTGSFTGTADFDPAMGTNFSLTAQGAEDVFVAKYNDVNGFLLYAKQIGGPAKDIGTSISYDVAGQLLLTGTFAQTADFNPDTLLITNLSSELGSDDCFTLKLDSAGNFIWVNYIAGPNVDISNSLTTDASGSVYITGGFQDITNFDPLQNNVLIASAGTLDGFVVKYSGSGQFQWIRQIGGTGADCGQDIHIDAANNLYVTGYFSNSVVLNSTQNAIGGSDALLVKYDINGLCTWSGNIGGTGNDIGYSTYTDSRNRLFAAGKISTPNADLDPTSAVFLVSGNGNSDVFYIKVNQNSSCPPAVSISASPNGTVCQGTPILFTATATNGGNNPAFQWLVNGIPTGDTTDTFTSSTLNNGDGVTCIVTSSAACAIPAFATSNVINPSLTATITASISISAAPAVICQGTTVTFSSTVSGTGSAPSYQWLVNGIPTGVTSTNFASSNLSSGDVITCQLFNSDLCVTPSVALSNPIVIFITPPVTQSITISASATTICPGNPVTFTANYSPLTLLSPSFQWIVNGNRVNGATSSSFTTSTLNNGALVVCEFSSQSPCVANPTVTSNQLLITVSQNITPLVTITASATTICPGSTVTFTATPLNGGSNPTYQWFVNNNVQAGANSATFSSSTLTNNNVVKCVLTSSVNCVSTPTANSNLITITTSTSLTPTITIQSLSGTTCIGSPAILEATYQFGGTNPTFTWFRNSQPIGINSPQLTITNPADNDNIRCVLVSNDACASPAPINSNTLLLDVGSATPPVISDIAGTLYSTSASTYQWLLNGDTIISADSIQHVPLRAGFYQVYITDANGCIASSNLVLITAPGVEEIDPLLESAQLFPNPANAFVTIQFAAKTLATVSLLSMDGKIVLEESINSQLHHELKTANLIAGLYIVRLVTPKGVRFARLAVTH